MSFLLIFFAVCMSSAFSDVLGVTGEIKFDSDMDGQAEMTLNGTGLGIGVSPSSNLEVQGNARVTGHLSVGGSSSSSNLAVTGSVGYNFQTISANTTLSEYSYVFVDTSSDNVEVTLPYAGNCSGRIYQIKKTSTSNKMYLLGGGNLIDDRGVLEVADNASFKLASDGMQWYVMESTMSEFQTVASDNLIGWWPFEESSGNTVYGRHSSGNNGAMEGFSGSERVAGKVGQAIYFDGNSSIDMGTGYALQAPFTLCAWFKADDLSANPHIMAKGGSAIWWRMRISTTLPGMKFSLYSPTGNPYSTTPITTGTWYHIVMTWDGATRKIYQDGIEVFQSATVGALSGSSTATWRIGAAGTGSARLIGTIDDVRIYNKALSASEARVLFQGQGN